MNKEQFRKELEDAWKDGFNSSCDVMSSYVTSRLAALDDGDVMDANWKENFKEWYNATEEERSDLVSAEQCVEWIEKNILGQNTKPLDDRQEGRGLGDAIDFGDYLLSRLNEMCEVVDDETGKSIWECDGRKEYTTEQLYKIYKSEHPNPPPAFPVADGEGEKVGWNKGISGVTLPDPQASDNIKYAQPAAPEKLEHPQDLIKSLNWCKNLLSAITASAIAGRGLDFINHGTPFFEEMLMAHQSAKAVLAKSLPSAVTGGVKDFYNAMVQANKALVQTIKGDDAAQANDKAIRIMIAAFNEFESTIQSDWTSVDKKLPEEGGRYWCYVEEINDLGVSHFQWNVSFNPLHGFDPMNNLMGKVTHWMPLPPNSSEGQPE